MSSESLQTETFSIESNFEILPKVDSVLSSNKTPDNLEFSSRNQVLASEDGSEDLKPKIRYRDGKTMYPVRAVVGGVLFLYGISTIWFPAITFSTPAIILSLIIFPIKWRRGVVRGISYTPWIGKKVAPFLNRIEENIEDSEVSFFELFKRNNK